MSDIEKLSCSINVSDKVINNISEVELKKHINSRLVNELSNYIMDNIDNLPIEITKEPFQPINYRFENQTYKMRVNLISEEELRRLQEIEMLFNTFRRREY